MLSCSVSEGNNRIRPLRLTTKSAEVYHTRYSTPLAFVCFGISLVVQRLVKISTNRFDCYRMLHCFSVLLIVCLVVYYRRR